VSNRAHVHVYRLDELSDRAVEGMPARLERSPDA
jgi:hypothetical protein